MVGEIKNVETKKPNCQNEKMKLKTIIVFPTVTSYKVLPTLT
jgi:hypothetical protein